MSEYKAEPCPCGDSHDHDDVRERLVLAIVDVAGYLRRTGLESDFVRRVLCRVADPDEMDHLKRYAEVLSVVVDGLRAVTPLGIALERGISDEVH